MRSRHLTRREMLRSTTCASVGFWLSRGALARGGSPSDKLNVAFVGVGGRGHANLKLISREGVNAVAVCDVDEQRAAAAFKATPWAKKYHDYRVMFDELHRQIDAVVISTPDHTHAPPSVAAMKMGKHCYCEKPLAHTPYEARVMAEVAAKQKVVTQIGTQHHAKRSTHQVVELIRSGAIGPVSECHVWIGGNRGGGERPKETPAVPEHLNWDLWLGPRALRPYNPAYAPYQWRFWWDFGTGETGNNGVHIMDFAFWTLKLRYPTTIAAEGPPVHAETSPKQMHVRYTFPARGKMVPVNLDFYHIKEGPPILSKHKLPHWESGVLFVGQKGMLLATYDKWKLYPEADFADFKGPDPFIPDSIGHHQEWVEACKTRGPTTCNFDHGGALTELVLLGNVAYRTGKPLAWDAKKLKAKGCPDADKFIREEYRAPWKLL